MSGWYGTCDWGDCDNAAWQLRWDDEHGFLPVCDNHEDPEYIDPAPVLQLTAKDPS